MPVARPAHSTQNPSAGCVYRGPAIWHRRTRPSTYGCTTRGYPGHRSGYGARARARGYNGRFIPGLVPFSPPMQEIPP